VQMSVRRIGIGLWALVLVAFALRIGHCAATRGLGQIGPGGYLEYTVTARRLLMHGTMVSPLPLDDSCTAPSYFMPPGYVGLVAGVYGLFGTETFTSVLILQIINAASSALAAALAFAVARRICGPPAAWIAAVITAINPLLIGHNEKIWDTSVFTLGVILCVWVSARLGAGPMSWKRGLAFGLVLGALALLNPALTIAYPFLVLWPLSRHYGWRIWPIVRGGLAAVCGWLIAVTPWSIRNYIQFGELTYVRGGYLFMLWIGVCPEADASPDAVFRRNSPMSNPDPGLQAKVTGPNSERDFINECGERAKAAIRADPWRLARLVGLRIVDYWAGTVFTHAPPGAGGWPRSRARAAAAVFLSGEVLIAALCLLIRRRITSELRWLVATVLLFSLVYCFTYVMARYRAPSEPIVAVIVAVSIVESARWWAARRHPA
jgi:4-amino-4-deoxy-L-arabinose transferase-like glycosyltransferase